MPNKTPSDSIRIFPSSNRATNSGHYTDNFVTEYNLSSIVNKLLLQNYSGDTGSIIKFTGYNASKTTGFVISETTEGSFEFNINGYFVNVSNITDITSPVAGDLNQNFVWFDKPISGDYAGYTCACIQVANEDNSEEGLKHLQGTEDAETSFSPTGNNIYAFPILDSTNHIPLSSKLRLTNFAIDDGEL